MAKRDKIHMISVNMINTTILCLVFEKKSIFYHYYNLKKKKSIVQHVFLCTLAHMTFILLKNDKMLLKVF